MSSVAATAGTCSYHLASISSTTHFTGWSCAANPLAGHTLNIHVYIRVPHQFLAHGGTGQFWKAITIRLSDLNAKLNGTVWLPKKVKHSLKTITNGLVYCTTHIVGFGICGLPMGDIKGSCWPYFPEDTIQKKKNKYQIYLKLNPYQTFLHQIKLAPLVKGLGSNTVS
ncbi:hypothetical protein VP01_85g9 [Puccinia sorghi]|uniref:Uncharacterized protein n=1 Tax=Puccinia sorghi TaxID=27349 RepID=A0A0L6U8X3_9BASI|nr:hypothetical protein VP01_85g9 [Puccinia sorghi]